MTSLIKFLLDPFNILLFLLLGSALLYIFKKVRICKWMIICSLIWLLLISTPFLPYAVLISLENRYDPLFVEELKLAEDEYHIVVLGSGYSYNERFPANTQLDLKTLGRLVEGVRIFNQLPNGKIVTSGPYNNKSISQAEVVKNAALLLKVPEVKILMQSEPVTTYEEAKYYHEKFYSGQKVIVVTSAAHMHRAISEFRRLGMDAIPSPTNYTYRDINGLRISIMPSTGNIFNLRTGVYEYAALIRNYFIRD
jgi:uncharacterized SAM-binding protein YcdF (DUF218 family)